MLSDILDRHAPVVSCHVRREGLPWIDSDIKRLMRKRNRLRRLAGELGDSASGRVTGPLEIGVQQH